MHSVFSSADTMEHNSSSNIEKFLTNDWALDEEKEDFSIISLVRSLL